MSTSHRGRTAATPRPRRWLVLAGVLLLLGSGLAAVGLSTTTGGALPDAGGTLPDAGGAVPGGDPGPGPQASGAMASGPLASGADDQPGLDQLESQNGTLVGEIDLSGANATILGEAANDSLGYDVAGDGDVNGDDVSDVVVGAPENDTAGEDAGAVYVFFGPVNGTLDASEANVTLVGEATGDRAGSAVALGDVDDDDRSDLVVGAPLNDEGGDDAGAAYVVYGNESLPANDSLANASLKLVGAAEGDLAGFDVAAAGDATPAPGDDVLVGAPLNDSRFVSGGAAYLDAGGARTGTVPLETAETTFLGQGPRDFAGWSVAGAGDFDGDGSDDVLVGAPQNDSAGRLAGAAYVVTASDLLARTPLGMADLKLAGANAFDEAGWAVAGAGDANADGFADVVVGAPFFGPNATDFGAAYVLYGSNATTGVVNLSAANRTLLGEGPDDNAGFSVAAAGSGDVTCDAFDDVLVGAPGNNSTGPGAGAAYLVAGSDAPPPVQDLSNATARLVGVAAGTPSSGRTRTSRRASRRRGPRRPPRPRRPRNRSFRSTCCPGVTPAAGSSP